MKHRSNSMTPPDEARSRTMRSVKGSGNATTELRMRALLKAAGLSGWRRHLPLPGRPDFAWPAVNVALFVDGCFWHGCPYCLRPMPRNNADYWANKVARNVARDRRVARTLRADGWAVIRVWEHSFSHPGRIVSRVARAIHRVRPPQ
jgi:DNA mismatch endonuclease (patch repair protein)